MYQRGDIVFVPFPFTDLASAKPRPALVVSIDKVNEETGDVILVMITSKPHTDSFTIPIHEEDIDFKLPKASFVRCHRLATIDCNLIEGKVGTANTKLINLVASLVSSLVTGWSIRSSEKE
jgi:mRNA interferase MazF